MTPLRFAMFGAGFWARVQLAGWRELDGARCVAVCDRAPDKAKALGVASVYADPEELLERERPDFVDIVTDVESHPALVELAARLGIPAICQKPMGPSLEAAERMVATCRRARTPLFIHENFRWQAPIREVKRTLDENRIGRPFRALLQFSSSFPVFDNQPALKSLDQFILTDVGSHHLDIARFLFGEAETLSCRVARINRGIRGEDVATVMLGMVSGSTVVVELSYASRLREERFPETFVAIEGTDGSIELAAGSVLHVTTKDGTQSRRIPSPRYAWADPAYDLVQSSVVPCNADLLKGIRGLGAETTGEDNLKTVRLVFAAYESARSGRTVSIAKD